MAHNARKLPKVVKSFCKTVKTVRIESGQSEWPNIKVKVTEICYIPLAVYFIYSVLMLLIRELTINQELLERNASVMFYIGS